LIRKLGNTHDTVKILSYFRLSQHESPRNNTGGLGHTRPISWLPELLVVMMISDVTGGQGDGGRTAPPSRVTPSRDDTLMKVEIFAAEFTRILEKRSFGRLRGWEGESVGVWE